MLVKSTAEIRSAWCCNPPQKLLLYCPTSPRAESRLPNQMPLPNTVNIGHARTNSKEKVLDNDDYLDFLVKLRKIDYSTLYNFYSEFYNEAHSLNPEFDSILFNKLLYLLEPIALNETIHNNVQLTNYHYLAIFISKKLNLSKQITPQFPSDLRTKLDDLSLKVKKDYYELNNKNTTLVDLQMGLRNLKINLSACGIEFQSSGREIIEFFKNNLL
jgi:hypothetical protein